MIRVIIKIEYKKKKRQQHMLLPIPKQDNCNILNCPKQEERII